MSEVTLSAGIRSNLISLQNTNKLLSQTQTRLATGKKVNSAIDNPNNYFKAASLTDRATGLNGRLDAMGQAISTIKSADQAITSIRTLTAQMKAVAEDAKGENDAAARENLGTQFNELIKQVDQLAKDAVYAGVNFLQGSTVTNTTESTKGNQELTVQFNEKLDESTLKVQGFSVGRADYVEGQDDPTALTLSGSELGLTDVTIGVHSDGTGAQTSTANEVFFGGDSYKADMDTLITNIESFEAQLSTASKSLANNLSVITTRQDFTQKQVNILNEGADKLTLADLNEEGANLLALNTAQQLGIGALSLASQANQQVLQLVG